MRRLLAVIAALTLAAAAIPVIPAMPSFARQQDYTADAVAAALLSAAIPEGDPFWLGPVTTTDPDMAINQLSVIEVPTVDGMVVYEIYPDSATASANLITDGAVEIAVDDALIAGYDDPASPAATTRQQQAGAILGIPLWTLDTGNGAGSCGQLRNVIVCGITPGSSSTAPDSPAVIGAVNGLAWLAMLAPPPSGGDVAPPVDAGQPADGGNGKKGKKGGDVPAETPTETPVEPAPADQPPVEQPPVEEPAAAGPAVGGISGAVIPQFAIPGGLNAPGPVPYAVTAAAPIDLDLIGNGKVQAAAGYTLDEVRFILAHPNFLDGVPYARVTEALSRRGSSLVSRYSDPSTVAEQLATLGFIDGYQRIFSFAGPPATVPGYVDITVSRFKDSAGAVGAVDALATRMIADGGMLQVAWGPYADKAIGFTGADINGMQRVGFVAAGPYLITITAVAPQGDPVATVNSIAAFIIATVSEAAPAQ